jgi:hypothetical protein
MFAPMKLFLLLRDEPCRAGVEESERLRPDGSTRLIHVRKATFSRHTRVREAATSGTNCEPTLSLTPPGPGSSMFLFPISIFPFTPQARGCVVLGTRGSSGRT